MSDISFKINGSDDPKAAYIAWTPLPLTIINNSKEPNLSLQITSKSHPGAITQLVFMLEYGDAPSDEVTVDFGKDSEKTIYVAGKFQPGAKYNGASADRKDVTLQAHKAGSADVMGKLDVMIRTRKNANELTDKARKDFLNALAKLNGIKVDDDTTPGAGKGIYVTDFTSVHVAGADKNEHGDSQFLPWHRLYVLDLERQLQQVNPAVTIPYWKFDEPAPNIFKSNFMGAMKTIPRETTEPGGEFDRGGANTPNATFDAENPLSKWQIGDVNGIPRTARFNPETEAGQGVDDLDMLTEAQTLALGGGLDDPTKAEFGEVQTKFASIQTTPHGAAHISFNGYINSIPVAPRDPLFFLIHCNVDRLWKKWQFIFERDQATDTKTYPYQTTTNVEGESVDPWKIVTATQWPWDGSLSYPGSLTPPGTRKENFTKSIAGSNFENNVPKIENCIDPYAYHAPENYLGFAYDDVPFSHSSNIA
mgnify:CR=1 FL=1